MSTENLWGTLPDPANVRTPLQILRVQSVALTDMTKGVLQGVIHPRSTYSGHFGYSLAILAPALNGYQIVVLGISYAVQIYPVSVFDEMAAIGSGEIKCASEEQFIDCLRGILTSSKVRGIIAALLTQSNAAKA
jgi:hypothetical protein